MLKDGRIVEQGTHEELMAMNGLYRETYQGQLVTNVSPEETSEGEGENA